MQAAFFSFAVYSLVFQIKFKFLFFSRKKFLNCLSISQVTLLLGNTILDSVGNFEIPLMNRSGL